VILADANLLLYAYDRSSPVHEPARRWLTEALAGPEAIGFSWHTILAFLRSFPGSASSIPSLPKGSEIYPMNPSRLSRRAVEIVAENRIREAMEHERFEDLPGFGQPIADIDEPYDPDWWIKKWIRREGISRTLAERFGKDFWSRR